MAHMKGSMTLKKGNMALMKGNMAIVRSTWRCAMLERARWNTVYGASSTRVDLLCCFFQNQYGPEKYIENVEGALDILLEHSPRTFVNLVPMFDVTPLTNLSSGPLCDILHR